MDAGALIFGFKSEALWRKVSVEQAK